MAATSSVPVTSPASASSAEVSVSAIPMHRPLLLVEYDCTCGGQSVGVGVGVFTSIRHAIDGLWADTLGRDEVLENLDEWDMSILRVARVVANAAGQPLTDGSRRDYNIAFTDDDGDEGEGDDDDGEEGDGDGDGDGEEDGAVHADGAGAVARKARFAREVRAVLADDVAGAGSGSDGGDRDGDSDSDDAPEAEQWLSVHPNTDSISSADTVDVFVESGVDHAAWYLSDADTDADTVTVFVVQLNTPSFFWDTEPLANWTQRLRSQWITSATVASRGASEE